MNPQSQLVLSFLRTLLHNTMLKSSTNMPKYYRNKIYTLE